MRMDSPRQVAITGAGGGLGEVLAQQFLARGDRVLACDVDADGLQRLQDSTGAGDRLTVSVCDLSDGEAVDGLAEALRGLSGGVDILVNTVGLSGPRAAFEEIGDDDWGLVFAVNVMAPIKLARAAIPAMKEKGVGAIIGVSTSSVRARPVQRGPYVVSKAALESVMLALSRELGPFGIRCNVVRPGFMDNARARTVIDAAARATGRTPDQVLADELQYASMRSMVSMQEVAAAILYLASDDARRVTGQILSVDAGHLFEA